MQRPAFEVMAAGLERRRLETTRLGRRGIGEKDFPVRGIEAGAEDFRLGGEGVQRVARVLGQPEVQRGGAQGAEDVRLVGEPAGQLAPEPGQLVEDERAHGETQRHTGHRHHDDGEFVAQGQESETTHNLGQDYLGRRLSRINWARSRRPACPAASLLIQNRIESSSAKR